MLRVMKAVRILKKTHNPGLQRHPELRAAEDADHRPARPALLQKQRGRARGGAREHGEGALSLDWERRRQKTPRPSEEDLSQ